MSITDVREHVIHVNGIDVHVARAGEPTTPSLLLLHGLYDRWETWDSVVRAFAPHYHVIAPDLRGHARSSHPKSNYAPQDYVEDLIGLMAELEIRQVVAIGHSLGAIVGEYLAAYHPDRVRALVLIDPVFEQNESTREWLNFLLEAKRGSLEETYETVKEMNFLLDDENEWRRQTDWLRATADGPFEEMIRMIDDGRAAQLYEVLRQITCPTLILQADPYSGGALSDAGAELAVEHLRQGIRQKFDGTGHSIHRERSDDFVQVVTDFLGRSV